MPQLTETRAQPLPCRRSADFVAKVFWRRPAWASAERDSCQGSTCELGFPEDATAPSRILSVVPSISRRSDFCNKICQLLTNALQQICGLGFYISPLHASALGPFSRTASRFSAPLL